MTVAQDIALALLQMVALTIPPIAVLIQMLRRSENLEWSWRRASFGLAISSVLAFTACGATVLVFFAQLPDVPLVLQAGMGLLLAGLVPFALFTGVLYREHRVEFGP
jgi:hypothetical protein